jgi:hypothetical protein
LTPDGLVKESDGDGVGVEVERRVEEEKKGMR